MMYIAIFLLIYALIIMLGSVDFANDNGDYLLVLGSKLENSKETGSLISRAEKAAYYLDKNSQCLAILSGGITEGNTVSEASILKKLMVSRGIDENRLILEEKSLNTYENFKFSKQFIDTNKKIVVCTNDYHLLRSRMMAKFNGYKVRSLSVKSSLKELLIHIPIEMFFLIKNIIDYH